jgi:uncharacterized protein (DUF697 family)
MTDQAQTLLQIGLAAACADGRRDERELAHLGAVARSFGAGEEALQQTPVGLPPDLGSRLPTPEARRSAYELATAVCCADGAVNDAERRFLSGLRAMLDIDQATAAAVEHDAQAMAGAGAAPKAPAPVPSGALDDLAHLDDLILGQAKLTAALELLPQSLASMAIIPLQMRLVYSIGQSAGQALDASQVTDLLGAMGIGVAAQMVDGVARSIVGGVFEGVLGRILGGIAGGVAGAATGAATSFATTYALGHAAKQYYAQGRRLSGDDLRALFARLKDEAATLYPKLQGEIEAQAKGLDLKRIVDSVRA